MCERCIRGCGEVKHNNIIGRTGKGASAGISFDLNDAMADSGCVQCGECMVSCPTSAITFKPVAGLKHSADEQSSSEILPTRELLADPVFAGIPPKFLLWQQGLVVRRRFEQGDVVCRQEDPGNTAFIIRSGRYQAQIYAPSEPAQRSFFGKWLNVKRKPVFEVSLTPKDLIFGEMSCLSGLPRSADVLAMEQGEVWELRRNVLDRLMRLPSQRERIERAYRERALDLVLRSTALFKNLPPSEFDQVINFLRERISFLRIVPGQSISRQGHPATDFYILRLGYVQISISRFGQEARKLSVGPGSVLGEISLLGLTRQDSVRTPEEVERDLLTRMEKSGGDLCSAIAPGLHTATATALDFVELARLQREDFLEMVRRFPTVRARLVHQVIDRLRSNIAITPTMDEYLEQGLYEARNMLVIDLDKCTRCDECTHGCIENHGTESHGVPLPRLLRTGQKIKNYLVATSCRSCATPHCMEGCPVDAIHRGKHLQIVIEDHCIGCGLCATNCPYGSIFLSPDESHAHVAEAPLKAATCDLCDSHGERTRPEPNCVAACPHDAALRVSGEEFLKHLMEATHR
jgi:Fe-S-cluster-containing hydrogenase component 2